VTSVHVVVPDRIDDPAYPSGGNVYDRRVCDGLAGLGWRVHEHGVAVTRLPGDLARVLGALPDRELVLVDGLVASAWPEAIVPEADRLRVVVLLHMPLGAGAPQARPRERAVLSATATVVTTSRWARDWLLDTYALPAERVHVAQPGVQIADLAPGTPTGGELVCVGAVTATKGQDLLVSALATLDDLPWRCSCVGALDLEPDFVAGLRDRATASGIADRLVFTGPLTDDDLESAYAGADLLVSASRAETYGMVVTEALARGLPVVATNVGGAHEALGRTLDGLRPGLLVPPGDPSALATALRHWLTDPDERERLRKTAEARRVDLSGWDHTSQRLGKVLAGVT
jgi:glycosyltransferase involved in cell wall biosynthesis